MFCLPAITTHPMQRLWADRRHVAGAAWARGLACALLALLLPLSPAVAQPGAAPKSAETAATDSQTGETNWFVCTWSDPDTAAGRRSGIFDRTGEALYTFDREYDVRLSGGVLVLTTPTSFAYSPVRLSAPSMGAGGSITASATITNTGKVAATEIAQLYIGDPTASYTRPVKELKGFNRVTLQPGESKNVTFELGDEQLGYYFPDGSFVVEPGKFKIWIAPNSAEGTSVEFVLQ